MIQLKRSSSGSYELTDKKQVVKLKEKTISLGEYQINTPGEYEQGGVEVIYSQSAALLVWDHLQIAYIFEATKPDAFEKKSVLFDRCLTAFRRDQRDLQRPTNHAN